MTVTTSSSAKLGDLDLGVPLAVGTLQWGTTGLFHSDRILAEDVCRDIVQELTAANVRLFDTAEGYGGGTSEKRLGRLLSVPSQQHLIMTKFLPAPWRGLWDCDFERAVQQSCQRLGVNKIHVYLLHSPVHWRPIEYWVQQAAACRAKGWLDYFGLSNANADQVRRAVAAGNKYGIRVVCNQVHYSLLDYQSPALQEMQAVCEELDVHIIGFTPIGQGLLCDNLTDEKFEKNLARRMLRVQRTELDTLRGVLSRLATQYEKSMAQVALNWCLQHNVIPLVGCRSVQQARDSVGGVGWTLAAADVQALDEVALAKSTLESPTWRRALFVTLFGVVNVVCKALDAWGWGRLDLLREKKEESTTEISAKQE